MIHTHWAEFTVDPELDSLGRVLRTGVERARELLGRLLAGVGGWRPKLCGIRGFDGYKFQDAMEQGVKLVWDYDRPEAHVVITGEACDWLELRGVEVEALWFCEEVRRITRWDFALDGLCDLAGKPIDPFDLYMAIKDDRKLLRSAVKDESIYIRAGIAGGKDTLYIGERSSDRQACIYNRRGYTRLELRVRGERAEVIRKMWVEGAGGLSWVCFCVGLVRDFVDFVEGGSRDHGERRELQAWWASCVGSFQRVRGVVSREEKGLAKTINWLKRSVIRTLGTLMEAFGPEYVYQLVEEGRRMVDWREVEEYRAEVASPEWDPSMPDVYWEAWQRAGGRESVHAQSSIPF